VFGNEASDKCFVETLHIPRWGAHSAPTNARVSLILAYLNSSTQDTSEIDPIYFFKILAPLGPSLLSALYYHVIVIERSGQTWPEVWGVIHFGDHPPDLGWKKDISVEGQKSYD